MRKLLLVTAVWAFAACEEAGLSVAERGVSPATTKPPPSVEDPGAPGAKVIQPAVPAEEAPRPAPRLADLPPLDRLRQAAGTYFANHVGRSLYIQADKPLYRPGETIWLRTWDLRARDLKEDLNAALQYELISPKGSVVATKQVLSQQGTAHNDFVLSEEIEGGEYLIRVTRAGVVTERPIIVSSYETPRIQKKLELVKKAYGAGDEVTATLSLARATGEPLGRHPVRGSVFLDGETLEPISVTTNAAGGALIRFQLPAKIERGDGLLTVLVEDAGVTESISKRVPIILKKVELSFFPEGGQLVAGLPARVYFEAKNTLGKPADVEGRIVDDHGNSVAKFSTYHHGLGRLELHASTGRKYHAVIDRPAGVTEKYPLPIAQEQGCTLRSYDDLDGELGAIRAGVRCTEARKVVVAAVLRETVLDAAAIEVKEGEEAVVHLEARDEPLARAQGIARITLFAEDLTPIAERIVFRNRRAGLQVEVTPSKKSYAPRDRVELTLKTRDEHGKPIAAELALSVVDDTVLSYADDKQGHLLSKLLLEGEIPGKIEEPKIYFDLTEEKSALAMELLMGTRGWRRFEWAPVFAPPPPPPEATATMDAQLFDEDAKNKDGAKRPALARLARPLPVAPARLPQARPADQPAAPPVEAKEEPLQKAAKVARGAEQNRFAAGAPARRERIAGEKALIAGDIAGWAPVRVFPAPVYDGEHTGPRTDFRDTIFWAPSVKTDGNGVAKISFHLSDAVTSFRATAEGVGGGRAGRVEQTVRSSLPFSLQVKLPLEVSAGDRLLLPVTLSNERDRALSVKLDADFGELLKLDAPLSFSEGELGAGERKSLFFPVTVTGNSGKSKVRIAARASGLSDELIREITVVPRGFPQALSAAGELRGSATHSFDLTGAIDGSTEVAIKIYPGPLSTLLTGLDGMLREPGGCFEQTSSSNYPNVMVLQYLKSQSIADAELLSRASGLADRGYQRLIGFETKEKGYEWFGQTPAHEALTAYGLVEFVDMARVMGGVDQAMLDRTAAYLRSRRDLQGGFKRDAKALDSFGRASAEVTNAYIVWSLTEAGYLDFQPEIEVQARTARDTKDAYLLALATNTLLNVPARKSEALTAARRLAALQDQDGAWSKADHSITRSTGVNLTIETTSLAVLALLEAGGDPGAVRKGVQWLTSNRNGYGAWGATQATVLGLKAMTEYAKQARKAAGSGTITVRVNGQEVQKLEYSAGQRDTIEVSGLGRYLKPGKNEIHLEASGQDELPYTIAADFRSLKPATDPDVVVDLSTRLARTELRMGETVRLTATVRNKTQNGQPMTLVRIGLPGGLTLQPWQLKELREKGEIAFWESRAREIIVYFRDLAPDAKKELALDLVALLPGEYSGPASSAYLYYGNDKKVWTDALEVKIDR